MKKYIYSIAVIFIMILVLTACKDTVKDEDKASDSNVVYPVGSDEKAKLVKVHGQLYIDMGYVNSAVTCGTADGEITSSVEPSQSPEKDNESNFGKGYEYQLGDAHHINVNIDGRWVVFQNLAISSWQIPSCVANFKAKITETSEDRLLVRVTDIPDNFKWIFQNKQMEEIKPISLPIEKLNMEDKKKKEEEINNLTGRTVQVWFDGSIKNSAAEMSYPIELGEIYKISLIEE